MITELQYCGIIICTDMLPIIIINIDNLGLCCVLWRWELGIPSRLLGIHHYVPMGIPSSQRQRTQHHNHRYTSRTLQQLLYLLYCICILQSLRWQAACTWAYFRPFKLLYLHTSILFLYRGTHI